MAARVVFYRPVVPDVEAHGHLLPGPGAGNGIAEHVRDPADLRAQGLGHIAVFVQNGDAVGFRSGLEAAVQQEAAYVVIPSPGAELLPVQVLRRGPVLAEDLEKGTEAQHVISGAHFAEGGRHRDGHPVRSQLVGKGDEVFFKLILIEIDDPQHLVPAGAFEGEGIGGKILPLEILGRPAPAAQGHPVFVPEVISLGGLVRAHRKAHLPVFAGVAQPGLPLLLGEAHAGDGRGAVVGGADALLPAAFADRPAAAGGLVRGLHDVVAPNPAVACGFDGAASGHALPAAQAPGVAGVARPGAGGGHRIANLGAVMMRGGLFALLHIAADGADPVALVTAADLPHAGLAGAGIDGHVGAVAREGRGAVQRVVVAADGLDGRALIDDGPADVADRVRRLAVGNAACREAALLGAFADGVAAGGIHRLHHDLTVFIDARLLPKGARGRRQIVRPPAVLIGRRPDLREILAALLDLEVVEEIARLLQRIEAQKLGAAAVGDLDARIVVVGDAHALADELPLGGTDAEGLLPAAGQAGADHGGRSVAVEIENIPAVVVVGLREHVAAEVVIMALSVMVLVVRGDHVLPGAGGEAVGDLLPGVEVVDVGDHGRLPALLPGADRAVVDLPARLRLGGGHVHDPAALAVNVVLPGGP